MRAVFASVRSRVSGVLQEVITLGRALNRRVADILAYFDRDGTSDGPTEAFNGGFAAMRKYANQWQHRQWAVEGSLGVGRPLSQRLLEAGERVVDVPAKLAARRVFWTPATDVRPTPTTRTR